MRILPPKDLVLMDACDARNSFIHASREHLSSALEQYEALTVKDKRATVKFLTMHALESELINLKSSLNHLQPAQPRSFIFRLMNAVDLRLMILQFEANLFINLKSFIDLDADILRENADIVLSLSEDASKALSLEVDGEYSHQELVTLNGKLTTLISTCPESLPAIIKQFNIITTASCKTFNLSRIVSGSMFFTKGCEPVLDDDLVLDDEPDSCSSLTK